MAVGTFFSNSNRRTIRAPINPMDKSTVISILPKEIHETKPTIQPGVFDIPAGTFDKPAILVVGTSSWWREIDEDQPMLEIPVSSIQVADSIVRDYCNGLLGCDMNETMPGLFYLPGELTVDKIKREHASLLLKYQQRQKNWYQALVKIADILWARSNGNPLAISEDARLAARNLNLTEKEWLKDAHTIELVRCPACGSLKNPNFPVCPTCKAVANPELAKKLDIKFAQ
jgi:hypothetical protein